MPQTAVRLAACALLGIVLAQSWLPVGGGFAGAVIVLAVAGRLRAHWQTHPAAPDSAERHAVLSGAATLVCLGFFLARLYQLGPDFDLQSRGARSMASELWTLIGASVLAQWIARAPAAIRDERDADIASQALGGACRLLMATQLALALWFTLGSRGGGWAPSPSMLVHLLICSWMVAHVFYDLACMHAYARTRPAARETA